MFGLCPRGSSQNKLKRITNKKRGKGRNSWQYLYSLYALIFAEGQPYIRVYKFWYARHGCPVTLFKCLSRVFAFCRRLPRLNRRIFVMPRWSHCQVANLLPSPAQIREREAQQVEFLFQVSATFSPLCVRVCVLHRRLDSSLLVDVDPVILTDVGPWYYTRQLVIHSVKKCTIIWWSHNLDYIFLAAGNFIRV